VYSVRRRLKLYSDILATAGSFMLCLALGYAVFEADGLKLGPAADALLWLSVLAFMVLMIRSIVHRFAEATERQFEQTQEE
jgi:hypothetical protein